MPTKYRKIETRIWNDEKFMALSDDGKLVFLFLLTHPSMTGLGAMRATAPGLASELGWLPARLTESLSEAIPRGMVEVNEKASYIGLPNFLKYNKPESPNVIKSWADQLELIPECPQRIALIKRVKAFAEGLGEAFREALPEDFRKTWPNQEQEQEQEQEQDISHAPGGAAGVAAGALALESDSSPARDERPKGRQATRWIQDLWNERRPPELAACREWTEKRHRAALARLKDHPGRADWEKAIAALHRWKFGLGEKGWRASIDWLLERPDALTKLLEGAYEDGGPGVSVNRCNDFWNDPQAMQDMEGKGGFVIQ